MKRKAKKYIHFTEEEDNFLRKNYLNLNYHELARQLGRSKYGVVHRLKYLNLKVPKEIMDTRRNYFPKGHVPMNKGVKGVCAPGCEAGWFKKGHLPANTLHDGAIVIRTDHKDRKGRQQKWIRLSKAKWQELQRYNWEKKYGKIPKGMLLRCINGDTLDCNPSNWRLITKDENRILNSNPAKGAIKMREHARNCDDLKSDKKIAFYLFPFNKKMQKVALKNKKLLEAKRLEIQLKRGIKNKEVIDANKN